MKCVFRKMYTFISFRHCFVIKWVCECGCNVHGSKTIVRLKIGKAKMPSLPTPTSTNIQHIWYVISISVLVYRSHCGFDVNVDCFTENSVSRFALDSQTGCGFLFHFFCDLFRLEYNILHIQSDTLFTWRHALCIHGRCVTNTDRVPMLL